MLETFSDVVVDDFRMIKQTTLKKTLASLYWLSSRFGVQVCHVAVFGC